MVFMKGLWSFFLFVVFLGVYGFRAFGVDRV